jgi:hypothetical protein
MADLHFRSFARTLLLLGVLAAASTLVLVPAAATYTGGTCNLSGVTANSVCFFKTYPRTSDNGQFTSDDSNLHNNYYPFSGAAVGDNNKDNVNGESYAVEICKNTSYTGGAQVVLSPNTGIVVTTPQGSSFRRLNNTCQG